MDTSPFDFVSALSAEELCPVCKELHAAVDECLCGDCSTHVCRDCSSLQPDTSWICKPCAARAPSRAYPVTTARPAWAQLQHARRALREQTVFLGSRARGRASTWLAAAGSGSQRALAALRTLTMAALAFTRARLASLAAASRRAALQVQPVYVRVRRGTSTGLQQLRLHARDGSARSWRWLGSSITRQGARIGSSLTRQGARVGSSLTRQRGHVGRQARLTARRALAGSASLLQVVRSWPLRAHTQSLLLATLILIAVARAEHGPEA